MATVTLALLHLLSMASALTLPPLPDISSADALLASHGVSGAANWLIPGYVMVGANPTKGRGSATSRVIQLCDGGCATFVSLQEEMPPADAPNFPPHLETYADDVIAVSTSTPAFVHMPIEDLRPAPSMAWLVDSVDELASRVHSGECLYVHCFAGRGRTGLVACCLLGALYNGVDAEEALERVSAYYKLRASFVANARASDGMSPETAPQRQQVRDYFASRS